MKKLRIAMVATNLKMNGISSVIMNYIQYINLEKFDITLIVGKGIAPKYGYECEKKGVKIIELPPRKEKPIAFYCALYKVLNLGNYDIVHVHGSNASIGMELLLAKLSNIKFRIAHSHNTTSTNMKINNLMKPIFNHTYTSGFACCDLAGKWLFDDKKFTIIPNGVEIEKFKFSKKIREIQRNQLHINNKFVVGHVGRFNYQKNHIFILKVFKELIKYRPNVVLLLIGNGPNFEKVKRDIYKYKLEDNIILFGETNKVQELYMAMDCFLFPSRFEGFPVTLLEAQISGLPAVISDVITKDIQLSDNLVFMSLKNTPQEWAKKLANLMNSPVDRLNFYQEYQFRINKFRINDDVRILENKYLEMVGDEFKWE